MFHRILSTALSFILTLAVAVSSFAYGDDPSLDTINLYPEQNDGASFDAELVYIPISSENARLILAIRNYNTSAGYITGFALNNPNDQITRLSPTPEADFPAKFEIIGADTPYNAVKALPYGLFDFGAALQGDFYRGGNGNALRFGLAPDTGYASHDFSFELIGDDLDTLTAESFLNETSKRRGGEYVASMVVNFKGLDGEETSKVVAVNIIGGGIGE